MKEYIKPSLNIIEITPEEGIAHSGSSSSNGKALGQQPDFVPPGQLKKY